MVACVIGKKRHRCLGCGKRSIYGKVAGVCPCLEWISAARNREMDETHVEAQVYGWPLFAKSVDVDRFRTPKDPRVGTNWRGWSKAKAKQSLRWPCCEWSKDVRHQQR